MRTWKWQACTSNFYQLARFSRATSVKADSGPTKSLHKPNSYSGSAVVHFSTSKHRTF
jgi:hypothetical protein